MLGSSRLVLMRGRRVTVAHSPYLDQHGEEDEGMGRGRPLWLSGGVYGAMSQLWGSAGLDFDSYLLHRANVNLGGEERDLLLPGP
jgi:hypothetical protein